ncbi:NrfD/PsrC family molybdoenzyme membrane anchor subunit [Pseudonocardia nigra]|uniref:NrfD/PsrC family molybdoenzyme membrane anchor subunit n=1 Tax=Pseudonocardia nigra TaxID=1921578 RepID=UPI001C5EAA61|nr:NrfD/PsrC family molybdoenzyme membrane anchor subunit [Pseudonocardia nigra]
MAGGPEPVDTNGAVEPRRRRGRKRLKGSMVPEAEFASYYGRPIIKKPTWKNPDVPVYLWAGGMAGTSSVLAVLADATGRPALRRGARLVAAGGAMAGTVALVHDLGRPSRFLNMLRVFKPTSPLSVGSWILAPYAGLASAAAASEVTGIAPRLGRLAGFGAALFGPPLAGYTAVLLSDTAVPAWHEARDEMPLLFVSSAAAAGAGAGLVLATTGENPPVARLGAVAAGIELAAGKALEHKLDRLPGGIGDAYRTGKAGRWNRLAHALTAVGGIGALLGRRSRAGSVAAGLALTAGSLATRFAVFEAGMQSAADPQHVVAPQRERLARRERASGEGSRLETEQSTSPAPRS